MMPIAGKKRTRGAALWMTVLVTLVLLTFFIGSVLSTAQSQAGLVVDELGENQARYAALGAIHKAFIFLEQNPNWTGSWEYEPMPQNPNIFHSLVADRTDPDIGSDEIQLTARGFTSAHGEGTPLAAVAGTAYRPEGGIRHASYADELLYLRSCNVDAYDATLGIGYVVDPAGGGGGTAGGTGGGTGGATAGGGTGGGTGGATAGGGTGGATGGATAGGGTGGATAGGTGGGTTLPSFSTVPDAADVGGNEEVELDNTNVDGAVIAPEAGSVQNQGRRMGSGANVNPIAALFSRLTSPRDAVDLPDVRAPFPAGSGTTVIDEASFNSLPLAPGGGRLLRPGAYSSVTVPEGQTLTFEEGDYFFEGGLFANGSEMSRVNLDFKTENQLTKIFIGGRMELNYTDFRPVVSVDPSVPPDPSAPATVVAEPSKLRIYGTGLRENYYDRRECFVNMQNTNFAGMVLGDAVIGRFDDCEIWGALMGRVIDSRGTDIHYDTSLANIKLAEHSRWRLRGLTEVRVQ